ncbi:hypothetical protein DFH06DRAFT_1337217 [Mycena polygramma]|nr:hypothetical protein DFH06DRAFT_1337217 [Mycena polygramma]
MYKTHRDMSLFGITSGTNLDRPPSLRKLQREEARLEARRLVQLPRHSAMQGRLPSESPEPAKKVIPKQRKKTMKLAKRIKNNRTVLKSISSNTTSLGPTKTLTNAPMGSEDDPGTKLRKQLEGKRRKVDRLGVKRLFGVFGPALRPSQSLAEASRARPIDTRTLLEILLASGYLPKPASTLKPFLRPQHTSRPSFPSRMLQTSDLHMLAEHSTAAHISRTPATP